MPIRKSSALVLLALASLFMAASCGHRELSPTGPYAGDTLLYDYDGLIEEYTEVCKEVVALADRNAVLVASRPDLAERVAKVRAEIDGISHPNETLTRLHLTRDAYLRAKTLTNTEALRQEIATARTLLEAARAILPLFATAPPLAPPQ